MTMMIINRYSFNLVLIFFVMAVFENLYWTNMMIMARKRTKART